MKKRPLISERSLKERGKTMNIFEYHEAEKKGLDSFNKGVPERIHIMAEREDRRQDLGGNSMNTKAEIKPIETEYKGYRFRSRLEARWAVFFDAIGAKWEYEPEGFQLEDGTRYLPDFLLHGVRGRGANREGDIYVEIKGILRDEDLHKVEMFPMPIIIFGQIPDAEWKEGYRPDGMHYAYWSFDYDKDDNEHFYNLEFSEFDYYLTEPKAGIGGGLVLDYPDNPYDFVDDNRTAEAYKAARQARFEHGEHGKIEHCSLMNGKK